MALTRVTDFSGRGVLAEIDPEFNNYRDYINNRLLTNPLTQDLDFGNQFTIDNLRTFWEIRNGAEYGGFLGSSVQAAINDLPSTGGLVLLPPGTYILSQTLTLRSGVTLLGYGRDVSILQRTSGTFIATSNAMLLGNAVTGCALKQLQVDGAAIDNTPVTELFGVRITGASSRFKTEDCWFRRVGTTAQSATPGNDGIFLDASGTGFWILGCLFEDFRRNGISIVDADRFFIMGNDLIDTGGSAANDSSVAIEIKPSNAGVFARRGVVQGNIIRGWNTAGIVCHNTGSTTVGEERGKIVVSDNHITDVGRRGILVHTMRNVEVIGNTVDRAHQAAATGVGAIHILNSEDVIVEGNQVYRSFFGSGDTDGIMVQGDGATQRCANIQVVNNLTDTVGRHSIVVDVINSGVVKNVTISANRTRFGGQDVSSAAEIQIMETSGTVSDLTIVGNHCTLDGQTPAVGAHHGVNFANAISDVVLVGNNLKGSNSGGGSSINGITNVTNLEVGHNLE